MEYSNCSPKNTSEKTKYLGKITGGVFDKKFHASIAPIPLFLQSKSDQLLIGTENNTSVTYFVIRILCILYTKQTQTILISYMS